MASFINIMSHETENPKTGHNSRNKILKLSEIKYHVKSNNK